MRSKLNSTLFLTSLLVAFLLPLKTAKPTADGIEGAIKRLPMAGSLNPPGLARAEPLEMLEIPALPSPVATPISCNTGNKYKDFIYTKESSCNPASVNSIGCRGLGQACPGSKLPCGADFACQDAYFSEYALSRYGSWEGAYNFWVNNNWW